jgi:outer membrane protein TolC
MRTYRVFRSNELIRHQNTAASSILGAQRDDAILPSCATVPEIEAATAMQAGDEWWKAFADPMLDDLIVRANVAKTSIEVASARHRGFASTQLSDLLKWSARAWGIGALLALPIFDGGRREAKSRMRRANSRLPSRYREQILGAFRDVEDQLAALRLLPSKRMHRHARSAQRRARRCCPMRVIAMDS